MDNRDFEEPNGFDSIIHYDKTNSDEIVIRDEKKPRAWISSEEHYNLKEKI